MSKVTKNKHVAKEVLEEFVLPSDGQELCRILSSRGNNLHLVENARQQSYLVSMPTKFRKRIWIKRGDFVIVEPIVEGDKVKGEIVHILYSNQIKHVKANGMWPELFEENRAEESDCGAAAAAANVMEKFERPEDAVVTLNGAVESADSSCGDSESESDDDDLFVNPNHLSRPYYQEDDDDEGEEEEESDSSDVGGGAAGTGEDDNNNSSSQKLGAARGPSSVLIDSGQQHGPLLAER